MKPTNTTPAVVPAPPGAAVPQAQFTPTGKDFHSVSDFRPEETGSASDYQAGEIISLATTYGLSPRENAIVLPVPIVLRKHKIYAYLWVNPSVGTDYALRCQITFTRNSARLAGSLPVEVGVSKAANSILARSLVTVCNGNTGLFNVQDCLGVVLSNPTGTQPTTALNLAPLYFDSGVDSVSLSVKELLNITDARLFLAVISTP